MHALARFAPLIAVVVAFLFSSTPALADQVSGLGDAVKENGTTLLTVIIGVYTWVSNMQRADRREVEALAQRVARLEVRADHSPTTQDVTSLRGALEGLSAKFDAILERLDNLDRRLDRYEAAALREASA